MSQPDSDHTVRNYGMSASFAWLLFEYCITLDQEIDLFWGQKITGASVLYLSNRYLPLFFSLWWAPWWRQSLSFNVTPSRDNLSVSRFRFDILILGGRRMFVFVEQQQHAYTHPLPRCPIRCVAQEILGGLMEYAIYVPVAAVLAGRLFLVLADVVVLSITWSTTFRNWKLRCNIPTISGIIFRDGTIYFIAQLFLNAFYLASMLLPPDIFDVENLNSIASLLILPATSVLVTHFLLDLQHASRQSLPPINASNWERMMGSLALLSVSLDGEGQAQDRRGVPPVGR
ncbi:hypothetical protein GSI_09906 [Ganoderma sinense ZZ0214-1]|uniref:DUF6533 domain-containing protein n=1 Tax=Ganoderma sinense ZZ0214-1 TaxID=1077348 RepID=A0A2G8S2I2_9APHY|nr:hypothetical protein GSI_09906 [Ganoderma sinense ZZ0214-1]